MSEMDAVRQSIWKLAEPDMDEIVADIEHRSRILQESGRITEALNLREWARELRQKRVANPY
ncbi:MAG: hypothetical protein AAGU11_18095 [Syntrophobacteraceae bacterium]